VHNIAHGPLTTVKALALRKRNELTVTSQRNIVNNTHTKPRLVFFQYKYDELLPAFLLIHKGEQVRCLSEFFEVTVIHEDSDYQQVCDKYQPDLALFESGVSNPSCRRLKIANIRACPQIPKLGFLHADAFCEGRAGFLSDMDHWGIDTFFAIAVTAAEHTPEISDNLFVWPNFVDPDVYRDYGQWKNIPVLFTGNNDAFYPWRRKMIKIISKEYPSLICPHPGYNPHKTATQVMVGESYARMLNASWFVPACGTVAKEVVRKHLEVPACKACLITEQSPALEAAGFVDMVNCVFADSHNILDKLAYLFERKDNLGAIIEAGYQLVHSRHTLKHRDQILQWFNLHKSLKTNQKIIQTGPFGRLGVVDRSLEFTDSHIVSNGSHLVLLRQGDEKLWGGHYEEAEGVYLRCLNYYRYMPEPQLRLALCSLYKGDAKTALSRIVKPIEFTLARYNAVDPDPVEWAYFIISFLCLGKVHEAVRRGAQFASLRHPELDRTRWVTNVLKNRQGAVPLLENGAPKYRFSIHQLPSRSFKEWIEHLCVMLRACGQFDLAETLTKCLSQEALSFQEKQGATTANREMRTKEEGTLHRGSVRKGLLALGREGAIGFFKRRLFYSKVQMILKRSLRYVLHRLEARCGYFLPYRLSEGRKDEFFRTIQDLTREEDIKAALVIGAVLGEGGTEALLAGVRENKSKPSVFCISGTQHRFINPKRALSNYPAMHWYKLSSSSPESVHEELKKTVKKIKAENAIGFFDVLLIDGSELRLPITDILEKELYEARFIFLDDINATNNQKNYDRLSCRDSSYVLVDQNPSLRNGYAIFEKETSAGYKVGQTLDSAFVLTE
jgi:Glycosyl transferases group 1